MSELTLKGLPIGEIRSDPSMSYLCRPGHAARALWGAYCVSTYVCAIQGIRDWDWGFINEAAGEIPNR